VTTVSTTLQQSPLAASASTSRLEIKRMQQASVIASRPEDAEADNYCRQYSKKPDLLPGDTARFWDSRKTVSVLPLLI
jgi:hypothetical protein